MEGRIVTDDNTTSDPPAVEPVTLTLELPGRLVADYRRLATAGVYLSAEEAVRHAVVTSWRHERGSYHTLRLDLGTDKVDAAEIDKGDQGEEPGADGAE